MISRKQFLKQIGAVGITGLTAGSPLLRYFSSDAAKLDTIGLQLYSIIPLLKQDFEGTLQTLSKIGYKEVEFAGPYYFTPGEDGNNSGFYGNNAGQMKAILDQFSLSAPSAHVGLSTLQNNLEETVEAAHTLGIQYLVCPFLTADQRQSLDDYKKLADQFNTIGESCKKAGIQFAYHNHCFEFGEKDGHIPYDLLLNNTDPELVAMELDLFWIIIAGFDPVAYFKKYPGRFPAVHVKDMKKEMVLEDPANTFENEAAAKKAFGNLEDVGKGVINFKRILSHHKQAGIKHYFIERDHPPQPMQTIKTGYENLAELEIS